MSVISLYYGQCGNQISNSFFSNIHEDIINNKRDTDYYNQALTKWFYVNNSNKWEPRSILIDTESKTIQSQKNNLYQFKNIVAKSCGGSANNWAFGYYNQSKLLVDQILECTRKELEKCDCNSSFLNIFSSSGGTGSGVGSFMTERLRHEFPKVTIINAVILPYSDGELVIQSYNTLLTLSKIYSLSDSIILFENDRLHYNCVNSLDIKDVNFTNMNDLISRQLLSIYQPLINTQTDQLFSKLCENSLYKFLEVRLAPLSKMDNPQNFKSLILSMSRQSRFDFQQKAINKIQLKAKSLSLALICRGLYNPSEKDLKPLLDSNLILENKKPKESMQLYYQRRNFFNLDNCLTTVSNSNSVYVPLKLIFQDALNLYKYGAYLHHYKKFNVDDIYFKTCFDIIDSILRDYEMEGWTVSDKKKLLIAVQKCGTTNISDVHKLLPHKTVTELRDAFETYSRLAANRNNEVSKNAEEEESSLKKWIELVSKVHKDDNNVLDIVSRVLKYIALFEDRDYDHTVSLKDCYLALSELCKGQLCTSLSYASSEFLYDHLQQLALRIKKEDNKEMKSFIQNLNSIGPLLKKEPKTYGKKKKSSKILNPLKVPDSLNISKQNF